MTVAKKLKKRNFEKIYGISAFIENEKNLTSIAPLIPTANANFSANRIGQKIEYETANAENTILENQQQTLDNIGVNEDVTVVRTVTLFGDSQELGDIARRREGKDLEFSQEFFVSNLPYISVNTRQLFNENGFIDHFFEQTNFGVGHHSRHKTTNRKSGITYPFKDIVEFNSVDFIDTDNNLTNYFAFPKLEEDNIENSNYIDYNLPKFNGAIDIFNSRIKTSDIQSDIYIKGVRANFAGGGWEDFERGHEQITNNIDIKQNTKTFFEDANDVLISGLLSGSSDESVDNLLSSLFQSSEDGTVRQKSLGFVTLNENLISFFEDTRPIVDNHEDYTDLLTYSQKELLLVTSSKNASEIGLRYKSNQNGFVQTPFYKNNEKYSFGTDSLAFSGLLKR